ncbi:12527_t:CDS:2 [Acaulospora morrowiae]|uniref:DASH complex subunit DAD2 n=1 Tax=Acaulospora morrowiae TaxID=94023 RepID=A0A9N8WHT8_9GLOM|nr:12527_t:CDS:2 [Acaulospora morrowiae]
MASNNMNNPFYLGQPIQTTLRQQANANRISVNVPSVKQISLSMKIQEKQEEYNNLLVLKKTSQEFAEYFNVLASQFEELNNGCETVATVFRNWQTVFRSVLLPEETKDTVCSEAGNEYHTHHNDASYRGKAESEPRMPVVALGVS